MHKKMIRILYHIGFWLAFLLLFVYQNPDAALADYLVFFWLLGIAAIVTYINLLYLLPRFYFKKKYGLFALLLLLLLTAGSLSISLFSFSDIGFKQDFIQDFINLLFIVIITSSMKFIREYQQKQARLIKLENEQLKTELKLLRAQVNPHFLFNTLSNLYGLILQHKNEQASEVTLKLADLMRYLLESSKIERVKLSDEVKFIEDYLTLERIRLSQNAAIKLEVSGLDGDELVAPFLLIPFVENVFKHGLNTIFKNSFANFTLVRQGNELYFEAENSLAENTNTTERGTGLDNLRKRLELNYPAGHLLYIDKTEGSFKASMQITL